MNATAGAGTSKEDDPDFKGHAQRATELGVLEALAAMASQVGRQDASQDMRYIYSQTLLGLLSTLICAFGLSPSSLTASDLSLLVQTIASLFQGAAHSLWMYQVLLSVPPQSHRNG